MYNRICKIRGKVQLEIEKLQAELQNYPKGNFVCCRDKKYYKWYNCYKGNKIYISKKNRPLAEKLAVKKYLTSILENLVQERKALDAYLQNYQLPKVQDISGYKDLLDSCFKPLSEELSAWAQETYPSNPQYTNNLIHKTDSGHMVRSKSEAMIAHFLYTNKIPFRYECALHLQNSIIYPDFTIRHPHTGEVFYWEHFGRMDDSLYSQKAYQKMQLYTVSGIVPSVNLITTFETAENPLSIETIQEIIEKYFL